MVYSSSLELYPRQSVVSGDTRKHDPCQSRSRRRPWLCPRSRSCSDQPAPRGVPNSLQTLHSIAKMEGFGTCAVSAVADGLVAACRAQRPWVAPIESEWLAVITPLARCGGRAPQQLETLGKLAPYCRRPARQRHREAVAKFLLTSAAKDGLSAPDFFVVRNLHGELLQVMAVIDVYTREQTHRVLSSSISSSILRRTTLTTTFMSRTTTLMLRKRPSS